MNYIVEQKRGKKSIYGFAVYPEVIMYDSASNGKAVQHLIFGDYINLLPDKQQEIKQSGDMIYARSRNENGWIKMNEVQKERILEINFVDIGQGDGCHIVTPDDRQIILDAGEEDNMHRFLSWRFNLRNKNNNVKDIIAIITHPDKDHYQGFKELFENTQLGFSHIYHNGIVERKDDKGALGSFVKINNKKYLSDIIENDAAMKGILNDAAKRGDKHYPNTLFKALSNPANSNINFCMLNRDVGFVPGFEDDKQVSLEVLGPVCEADKSGKLCLKYFGSEGLTKNGHSVSIMLRIGRLKVFLGGDLNTQAENYLLNHYTGADPESLKKKLVKEKQPEKINELNNQLEELVKKGNAAFGADIAKSCHHGSHDFTSEFLRSINAIATVVSSGDNESYGHPRPDALGAIGKFGRGERPLIFSTELARSHKESIKKPYELKQSIKSISQAIDEETDVKKKQVLKEKLDSLLNDIEKSVAVYGMINVRTDGNKVIICQKLEKARDNAHKWDIHELIYNPAAKDFQYKIKA